MNNNNSKKSEEIHAINRLTFISLITGFLLSILFQVAVIPKNGKTIILTGLFFSLLIITLLFLFVFLLFLVKSFEISQDSNPKIIQKITNLAKRLLYLGLFGFNVFLHYLIRLFLYPADGKIIALVFTIIYSTCLILVLFILQYILFRDIGYLEEGILWIIFSGILISIPIFF